MWFFPSGRLTFTPAVWCFVVASCVDGMLSLLLFELRMTTELNPLLARAYGISPAAFIAVKVVLLCGVLYGLAFVPDRAPRRWTIRFGALAFIGAVGYECMLFALYLRF